MIRLMVGRSLDQLFPKEEAEIGEVVFRAEGLSRGGLFSDVSFELRRGEIVGLAGFVGAGRTEVARAIFGVDPLDDGKLWIEGRPFRPRSPRAALRRGLAYLPEDRIHQGLVQPMSISQNASMAVLPELTPAGILRPRRERRPDARRFMEQLRIKATSPAQVVRSLSGGNQQKVVLSKWLAAEPRILILDEPTHGVDVGTKADVHRTISHLADAGPDDPDDLVGAAGDPRHERPRARDAGGPARRGALARRGDAGARSSQAAAGVEEAA